MVNVQMLKLFIGLQLEIRTMMVKLADMEKTVGDILFDLEHPPVNVKPHTPPLRNIEAAQAKLNDLRQTPAYKKKMSEQQIAYWAGPKGQARRAKGKRGVFGDSVTPESKANILAGGKK
jgi:hypothetical protein